MDPELLVIAAALDDLRVVHTICSGIGEAHWKRTSTASAWTEILSYAALGSGHQISEDWLRLKLSERGLTLPALPPPPGAALLRQHVDALQTRWTHREIQRAIDGTGGLPALERLTELHAKLDEILRASPVATRRTSDIASDYLAALQARPEGFRVGIETGLGIEKLSPGGIPLDKLTILFAQTGHLKSTTGLNLLCEAARRGNRCVYFSLEDSEDLVGQALLSIATGIPLQQLYLQDLSRAQTATVRQTLTECKWLENIVIESQIPRSMRDVVSRVRRHHSEAPVSLVLVDYAQLFDYSGPEREALGEIAKVAREAAHHDRMAYVLLSQVNEAKMRERKDYRPQLDDIFGSSVIKQCAKLAIGIYRPSIHTPAHERDEEHEWRELPEDKYNALVELHVRKNKLGGLGRLLCHVDLPTGRMSAWDAGTTPEIGF